VYAMAGSTDNHDRIAFNLLKAIDNHLGADSDCQFYSGNVKVNYRDEFYYYPDAFVTCDLRDRRYRYPKGHDRNPDRCLKAGRSPPKTATAGA